MIHFLISPIDIYDTRTAENLTGTVIVGDDFAGGCEAYGWKNGWQFGTIDEMGDFVKADGWPSLPEFLYHFLSLEQVQ